MDTFCFGRRGEVLLSISFWWVLVALPATGVVFAEGNGMLRGANQPFVPPGSLWDNGVSNGTLSILSQDSSVDLTTRAADDFILEAGCLLGYYQVSQIRAQVNQFPWPPQPFSIDLYHDNGTGQHPDPFHAGKRNIHRTPLARLWVLRGRIGDLRARMQ